MVYRLLLHGIICLLCLTSGLWGQNLQITNITPGINQNNVDRSTNITIDFDQTISAATLHDSAVVVRGSQSGKLSGVLSGGGSTSISFDPDSDFRLAEVISVTITTRLASTGGNSLLRGHTYSFTALSGAAPQGTPVFAQRNISAASSQGREVKTLDLDRDGDLDIVAASEGIPEQIIFYENLGDLEFCGTSIGGNFRYAEVYDIDGDGDFDNFGATGSFDTELNWFENEGTTPFTEHLISVEDPWTLAGGDIDSDGDIDVLAAVILPNRLLWFANDGSGNFSGAMSIPTTFGGGSDSYFYIRDVNGDGAMDILAFHRDDMNLVWYANDGSMNFTEILIANRTNRQRLASGDIDGDGDFDIVTVAVDSNPGSRLSWYENDGSENFTEHPITITTTGGLTVATISDLDGDMDMDIQAGGYWFENDGSEQFTERPISAGLAIGANYGLSGISYGDIDNDGDLDVVSMGFRTFGWQENGQFMNVTATSPANGETDVATDANISITFDQLLDGTTLHDANIKVRSKSGGAVAGSFSGGGSNTLSFDPLVNLLPGDIVEVSISDRLLSSGNHRAEISHGFRFQVAATEVAQLGFTLHPVITHSGSAFDMDCADIDGDGDIDLLSCSLSELYWHENDGSGNFTAIPLTITGMPIDVQAADLNGDGFMDIWIDNSSASSMIYYNDGNQNFSETEILGEVFIEELTDVNNDGDIDLLWRSAFNGWLGWADRRCDAFLVLASLPRLDNEDVRIADMDNDGDNDFVAASFAGPIFYENNGYYTYVTSDIDNAGTSRVYLSDLDGDNDLDPLLIERFAGPVWYENRLTGDSLDFGPKQQVAVLDQDPRDVIAADIDGDGDPDVAAVSGNDDKLVWYENRLDEASADFGPEQLISTAGDRPIRVQSVDLDGDGDMDLITLSDGDEKLTWFENTGTPVGIDDERPTEVKTYSLAQNYPNPFNPTTTIAYTLPQSAAVTLTIYNIAGQSVRRLVNRRESAGQFRVSWDGRDDAGYPVASGVYVYRLNAGEFEQSRKMLLLR